MRFSVERSPSATATRRAAGLVIGSYLPILPRMPRRKPGTLLPLETEILAAALALRDGGLETFHGFGLAQTLREQRGSRALTAHGTLYKALGRLEERGLLTSHWEDPPAAEGRPRRRLYALTAEGERAAQPAPAPERGSTPARHTRTRPKPA